MMIVELIDEVDFKDKLLGIGAPIEPNDTLEEVTTKVDAWLVQSPEQLAAVKEACTELEASGATILPEVLDVIQALQAR
ncbi:hypothetical protein [Marinomonas ostreistagni]|uniref:hypothetical protein n=1 Tax=Marinomonas ostreistagni TaxID=359209 RepID=UPI0019522F5B|nr:hypothetical protein [Marinomonas ostreistagni]MBM6549563.1 hypothetical protein [Marinomonas ostreistagni]